MRSKAAFRAKRELAGITQSALAEELGVEARRAGRSHKSCIRVGRWARQCAA